MGIHPNELAEVEKNSTARARSELEDISFDCAKAKNLLDSLISQPVNIVTETGGALVGTIIDYAIGVLKEETNENTVDGYLSLLEGAGYGVSEDAFLRETLNTK